MSVCPRKDSDDKQEWFSYSTGLLFSYNHPEIILCGLSSRTAHAIINEIGNAVASGRKYDLDKDYTDIFADEVKCRFPRMHFSGYSEYVLLSRWFYEDDQFPVWQCFWPDEEGFYPWDAACDPEVIESQPNSTSLHFPFVESASGRCAHVLASTDDRYHGFFAH
jgi:Domain of unknown function (DUF4262)